MVLVSGKKKVEPSEAEPLVEGGMAVSFSDPKWEKEVKARVETRKKKPASRPKKKPANVIVDDNDGAA